MTVASGLSLTAEGGLGVLTIDRPQKRNALDLALIGELAAICSKVEGRDDIRVLVVTGAGGSFCAGGDITAWSTLSPADFSRHWVRSGHEAFDRLARLRQPVIAVLNGSTMGGGLELAACADYRIAESHVKIGQPETSLGIIPGWSGSQRAVRRFGAQAVRRMAVFGQVLDADAALAVGIVDEVAPTGSGLNAARALAARLTRRGPQATELTKMLINAAEGEERERVLDALAGHVAAAGTELAQGLAAFRAKRPPDFTEGGE